MSVGKKEQVADLKRMINHWEQENNTPAPQRKILKKLQSSSNKSTSPKK